MIRHLVVTWTILIICLSVGSAYAQFAGGSGTQADPWQVATAEHLNNVRNYLGTSYNSVYFIQMADIDLGIAPWNQGEGWVPIGGAGTTFFGNYDGQGRTIDGLFISRPSSDYQGLFGHTYNAVIQNLGITNVNITAHNYVGALIGGASSSSILRCYSTGSVTAYWSVGGLIGAHWQGSGQSNYNVRNCFSRVNVMGNSSVGGLMGAKYYPIYNCYSTGSVGTAGTSPTNIGGLVGQRINYDSGSQACYWDTETSGRGQSADGEGRTTVQMTHPFALDTYVGWDFYNIWMPDYDYSRNDGYPVLRDPNFIVTELPSPAINPEPASQVHYLLPNTSLGWQTGFNPQYTNPPTGFRLYLGTDNPPSNMANGIDVGLQINYYPNLPNDLGVTYYWQIIPYNDIGNAGNCPIWSFTTDYFAGGSGTEADPWQVANAAQLNMVREFISYYPYQNFIQTADIDLGIAPWNQGEGWVPIGSWDSSRFRGSYDGNGHIIDNLYINRPGIGYQGLFGYVYGGTVSNLGLTNASVTGGNTTGCLAGTIENGTIVDNCHSTGQLNGVDTVGGLCGTANSNSTVSNSHSTCSVSGNSSVGGLLGSGMASYSYSSGNVTGGNQVGGLIGYGSAGNSHSTGNVLGVSRVGGLIGSGGATYCHSSGNVSGTSIIGGLIGEQTSYTSNTYSTGIVSGSSDYVGGLIGLIAYWCNINNSFSSSRVIGGSLVGGLIGGKPYGASVTNCYSSGQVSGSTIGGLIGYLLEGSHGGGVSNSFWDINTSGTSSSMGGLGRNTDQMTYPYAADTFTGWNFSTEWGVDLEYTLNDGYPFLLNNISIAQSPLPAFSPYPADGELSVLGQSQLAWLAHANQNYSDYPTGFRLWLGTDNPPTNIASGVDLSWTSVYDPEPDLALNTTYYWQIVPYNSVGDAAGCPIWSFTTFDPDPLLMYPNGGELWLSGTTRTIRWAENAPPQVNLHISYDNGNQWNLIMTVDGTSGFHHFQVPATNSSLCRIKISSAYDESLFDISDNVFSISTSGAQPKVVLTYPSDAGVHLGVGHTTEITWTRQNVTAVALDLSVDDGDTWTEIASGMNSNSYLWPVPDQPGLNVRLRVRSGTNPEVMDISDNAFSISKVAVQSPNGGETITSDWSGMAAFPVMWAAAGMENVKIDFSTDGGAIWSEVTVSSPAAAGSFSWILPGAPTASGLIRIANAANPQIFDISDASFNLRNPVKIINANGGGFITNNSLFNLRWLMQDIDPGSMVYWEYSADNSAWTRINTEAVAVTDLGVPWYVNTGLANTMWLRAVEDGTNRIVAKSETPFTVTDKMLVIYEPDGGEVYQGLSGHIISWDFSGLTDLDLSYTHDDGLTWIPIAEAVPANNASLGWTVPDTPSENCRVRIQDTTYPYMVLESQVNFTILPAVILLPEVDFTADILSGEIPLSVQFTEFVSPGVGTIASRLWDFGDGNASGQEDPQHVYTVPGLYTISLTVGNSYGADSTMVKTDYIEVLPNRPQISLLSPPSLNFGIVYLGDVSVPQDVRIKNTGTAPLTVDSLSFNTPDSRFSLLAAVTPFDLAVGDSTAVQVVFTPLANGVVADTLFVCSDAFNQPVLPVSVRGQGQSVPPSTPQGLVIEVVDNDILLSWQPVTTTIYGSPIVPDGYIVLGANDPYAGLDSFVFLGFVTGPGFTHPFVAQHRPMLFYRIVAVKDYREELIAIMAELSLSGGKVTWGELRTRMALTRTIW
jgi:PKD repeat protein